MCKRDEGFLYPRSARKEDASVRNEIWNQEGGAICGALDKAGVGAISIFIAIIVVEAYHFVAIVSGDPE